MNRVVVSTGPSGAWSRLERGELRVEEWIPAFERDCEAAGQALSAAFQGNILARTLRCAGLIAAAAVAGSWIESVAGSWNRRHGSVISNGSLNFFNTAAGAAMMLLFSRFLP